MFIVKIFYFLILMIISDRCLRWVWKAVYRSAYKREEDVERYKELNSFGKRRDNTTGWVIDSSPNPFKTLAIVALFYIGLLPAAAGQFLVPLSLLLPSMERVVNIFAVAVPVLCIIYIIAGFIYNKVAKEPDYDKFGKKNITDYESQKLAYYAEDWETGEYKSKSRFVPSRFPQYLIIIVMVGTFASIAIIASLNGGRINLSSNDMQEYREALEAQGISVSNYGGLSETYGYLINGFHISENDVLMSVYLYDNAENAIEYSKKEMAGDTYTHYTDGDCEVFIGRLMYRYIIYICRDRYVAEINSSTDSLSDLNKMLHIMDFCEIQEIQ